MIKPDAIRKAGHVEQKPGEKPFVRDSVTFFPDGAKTDYQVGVPSIVINAIAEYIETPVQVRYREMGPENHPGLNSIMLPEFRDADYFDSIAMNSNHEHPDELPFFMLHELGHSLEVQVQKIMDDSGIDALPIEMDTLYGEYYADLVAVYALRPELLQQLKEIPQANNSVNILREIFQQHDFEDLRKRLDELAEAELNEDDAQKADRKQRHDTLFTRVHRKIDELLSA